ncbi:MAG: EAL domain-containing protein [Burkholderiales bacterium]|nr:EAL domain-containing protein [Burkholderiales bacterium]
MGLFSRAPDSAPSAFVSMLVYEPQRSLRRQLTWRLMGVFALVALLGSAAVVTAYQSLILRGQREAADDALRYVTSSYAHQVQQWERDAIEVKAQIDFMRIFGEDSSDSWLRLRAYFAALEGKVDRFSAGAVMRKDGTAGMVFGADSQLLARRLQDGAAAPLWLLGNEGRTLYLVHSVPLWLGVEGTGRMVLLQPLDNGVVASLAAQDVHLHLVLDGRVLAGTAGSEDVGKPLDASFSGRTREDGRTTEQRIFPFLGNGPHTPVLVIHQQVRERLSVPMLLIGSVALLGVLTLLLWLVIGRWAKGVTDRVSALSKASALFAVDHAIEGPVRQALDQAQVQPDEIGDVAQASRDMMESVRLYDEEHFAYLQTLDILEEGVVEIASDGSYLRASPGWTRLAGTERSHRGILFECFHPEDVDDFRQHFGQLFTGEKTSLKGRIRLRSNDGNGVWLEYRFVVSELGARMVRSVRGVLRDITQSYLLEKHVTHMALHDALTGLPNRVLLEDRCKIALRTAERNGHKVALGFMDLDHFKHVNDQFGHKAGDEMLLYLSNVLHGCLRAGDTLARWGGDEFVVLLTDLAGQKGAHEAIAKMGAICQEPIVINGNVFNATFSMGVAIFPDDASTVDALLSQADRAMFSAKQQGRNTVRFFADISNVEEERELVYIQHRLAAAIKDHKIQTWFQPIVDVRTRQVVSCEALARWYDDSYGWVSPATFIPMAESLGLIRELGQQVWQQAVQGLHRWREAGMDMRISVNVSRRQLFTPTFTADLLADLDRLAIPVSVVDLEITESVAMEDADFTARRLIELTEAGFGIAIDDFGTGYSSLSQLHDMPATKIKIDISFVRRAHSDQGAQLIQAIVNIAGAFKLQTVAEGVESDEIAASLQGFGVDLLQGYHFGKPMPVTEFEHYLATRFNRTAPF